MKVLPLVAGLDASHVHNITKERYTSVDIAVKLAWALQVSLDDVFRADRDESRSQLIPVPSEIACCAWSDPSTWNPQEFDPVPPLPSSYAHLKQSAWYVRSYVGIAFRTPGGGLALAAPYDRARLRPAGVDSVVVEQRRDEFVECTCREVRLTADAVDKRSTNPHPWQGTLSNPREQPPDDGTAEIVGLVLGVLKLFKR